MEKKRSRLDYVILYLAFLVYSVSTVFAKLAAQRESLFMMAVFLGIEVFFLGVYAIIWQQVLKRFPLIVAMSNKGVCVIFALLWSVLIFSEHITLWNVLGSALIILGIWMVSSDD